MISDLILCHKVRKLFAIIITQKEEIRSQNLQEDQIYSFYRKTNLSYKLFEKFFLSRIESLLLANIHIRFMNQKTSICAVVHITRMDEL